MIYEADILGIRLKHCRTIRGFTQYEVAQRLGITPGYYSLLENGKKNISVAQLIEFADMHRLTVSAVIGESVEVTDITQKMGHTDLKILEMLREMDDKSKEQLLKHLQIMQHPELLVVTKPRKPKQSKE